MIGSLNYNNVSAGNVSYNDSSLYFTNSAYSSYFPVNMAIPQRWNLSQSAYIPAFTYSFNPFFFIYTGQAMLPDTCVKGNGLTFNLSGISNNGGNSVSLSLTGSSSATATKTISGNGTVTFTPAELNNFSVNANSYLTITLTNYEIETFGGVVIAFSNVISHQTCIWMK